MSKQDLVSGRVRLVLIFIGIAIAAYTIGFFASKNSEAFGEAKKFISASQVVNNELGRVIDVKLTPFGYDLEFSGSSGDAAFSCNIEGSLKRGKATIKLHKNFNIWHVTHAVLLVDEREVTLIWDEKSR